MTWFFPKTRLHSTSMTGLACWKRMGGRRTVRTSMAMRILVDGLRFGWVNWLKHRLFHFRYVNLCILHRIQADTLDRQISSWCPIFLYYANFVSEIRRYRSTTQQDPTLWCKPPHSTLPTWTLGCYRTIANLNYTSWCQWSTCWSWRRTQSLVLNHLEAPVRFSSVDRNK